MPRKIKSCIECGYRETRYLNDDDDPFVSTDYLRRFVRCGQTGKLIELEDYISPKEQFPKFCLLDKVK